MLTYYIPLCYFVIAFVPLSGKKINHKGAQRIHKGFE